MLKIILLPFTIIKLLFSLLSRLVEAGLAGAKQLERATAQFEEEAAKLAERVRAEAEANHHEERLRDERALENARRLILLEASMREASREEGGTPPTQVEAPSAAPAAHPRASPRTVPPNTLATAAKTSTVRTAKPVPA